MQNAEEQVVAGEGEEDDATGKEKQSSGLYSDQQNIDAECEKLLWSTKKQVKQMMEEAVTKKFIHEESSSIISLCVAVEACLSHGLKRRALGLFKTSSSTALIQKVSKNCKSAQEVLDTVEDEEKKFLSEQQQNSKSTTGSGQQQADKTSGINTINSRVHKSPIKQVVASNINVHKRNRWIKVALIDKKLVAIVDHLAENALKYYEPKALMANWLCAQILSSLLVGPSALEFSRSKTSDYYQFEDPSADELMKRHKLANPIACLCSGKQPAINNYNNQRIETQQQQQQHNNQTNGNLHNKLSRSVTENLRRSTSDNKRTQCRQTNSYNLTPTNSVINDGAAKMHASHDSVLANQTAPTDQQQVAGGANEVARRSPSPNGRQLANNRNGPGRRRPLAIKTNPKRGTIVTDCHHYSCQEISEHHQTRGYSFLCSSSSMINAIQPADSPLWATSAFAGGGANNSASSHLNHQHYHHEAWSPKMLHETLHQNSRSNLLYAKNNVLLESQPNETMAGYLSLHQTSSDLILKWIPNQMINGSQSTMPTSDSRSDPKTTTDSPKTTQSANKRAPAVAAICSTTESNNNSDQQPTAVESSYLDLVVSLSVSRIVLLHCQFNKYSFKMLATEPSNSDAASGGLSETQCPNTVDASIGSSAPDEAASEQPPPARPYTEETLILVEADGVQRAPFKFPKGGLRLFLSCLESGLRPDKYLDPAIQFDDSGCWLDPLQSPLSCDWAAAGFRSLSENPSGDSSQSSRLDSLLKRLPSLKRRTPSNGSSPAAPTAMGESSGPSGSAENQLIADNPISDAPAAAVSSPLTTDNYVFRIVSIQQPDWPLITPPHSALSVGKSSSSSCSTITSTTNNQTMTSSLSNGAAGGQKFRWSLSRLARFSARYTNSSGSTTSTTSSSTQNGLDSTSGLQQIANEDTLSSGSGNLNNLKQATTSNNLENNSFFHSLSKTFSDGQKDEGEEKQPQGLRKRDNSSELARIEAKLDHLKESTSGEILALRTQSVQALCESMRKQIVARAFYGWLVHCRKVRIIRAHLIKLIHPADRCCLLMEPEEACDGDTTDLEQLRRTLDLGLTRERWTELMRNERKLNETQLCREVNQFVYYGGVAGDGGELRREVWPYLLGHYQFTDDQATRLAKDRQAKESYECCVADWIKIERVVKQRDNELLAANMAKVSRDAQMNKTTGGSNRTISETSDEIVAASTKEPTTDTNGEINPDNIHEKEADNINEEGQEEDEPCSIESAESRNADELNTKNARNRKTKLDTNLTSKRRRRRARLESTGSVGSDASITDQYGNNIHRIDKDVQRCDRNFWYFKDTRNLDKLRNIMCTYVWKHLDVGYVQGMCDLAAPFLVIFDDEIKAYNCFSQLMKRMESNFPHGSTMDQHFESLKQLIQILDPKLFDILQSNGDYTHFYFCYRWLLLDFKRELAYEDVYKVWETIWSARVVVTDHFVVFMALAMVRYYRDIIIENNMDFTDTIKFFNEMAERHDAKGITALARDCIVELKGLIKTMEL